LGTFISIKIWDQIQTIRPKIRRIRLKIFKRFDWGILKREEKIKYKIKPRTINGKMKGPILSPLPVKSFNIFTAIV
jgi:hypothetical protein